MKKLIFLILTLSTFLIGSCASENEECNCGIVTEDDIVTNGGNLVYLLYVQNDCSGRIQSFSVSRDSWMEIFVGDRTCIPWVQSWRVGSGDKFVLTEGKRIMESE